MGGFIVIHDDNAVRIVVGGSDVGGINLFCDAVLLIVLVVVW